VAPRAARPLGRPGSWVSANDYPARDLREGNQGLVRFRLAVGADGGVTDCVIVGPSGFPGLDSATCDNLRRRARFEPASDGTGAKVAGSYAGTIRWLIPER
jgi:protein TonB